jgi:hypothetical protein
MATKKKAKKKATRATLKTWEGGTDVTLCIKLGGIPAKNEAQAEARIAAAVEYIVNALRMPKDVVYAKGKSVPSKHLYMEDTDVNVSLDGWGVECEDDDF